MTPIKEPFMPEGWILGEVGIGKKRKQITAYPVRGTDILCLSERHWDEGSLTWEFEPEEDGEVLLDGKVLAELQKFLGERHE